MVRTLFLFFLLLFLFRRGSTGCSSTPGRRSSGSTTSRTHVQQEILHVLAFKRLVIARSDAERCIPSPLCRSYLCEERCPYRLDVGDIGGFDEGLELVGLSR